MCGVVHSYSGWVQLAPSENLGELAVVFVALFCTAFTCRLE